MKEIKLTQGKITLVDDDMFEYLNQWKWTWLSSGGQYGYARRGTTLKNGKHRIIQMHKVIINAPEKLEIDHIDGNGLNNCRNNLRICSHAENLRNSKKHSNNKSGYKGVAQARGGYKWRAHITINGKYIHLGTFNNILEAAKAYNMAAIKYFGEFARPNFIEQER